MSTAQLTAPNHDPAEGSTTFQDAHRDPATRTPLTVAPRRGGLNWWKAGALGAVVVAVGNVAVYGVGRAAGASFEVVDGDNVETITAGVLATMSAVPLIVGVAVTAVLAMRWSRVIRLGQAVGAGLSLATIALAVAVDADGATKVSLTVAHVVLAVVVVATLEAGRRRHAPRLRPTR